MYEDIKYWAKLIRESEGVYDDDEDEVLTEGNGTRNWSASAPLDLNDQRYLYTGDAH